MPKIHFKINLTDSQKEAYEAAHQKDIKFLTLIMSRQSGKSVLMKILCIEWLFKPKKSIAYVCRNYILAKKLYKDVVQYMPKEYIQSANGSDLIITSKFGSTLTFFSAESGASLRGLTFNYLICDEFAFFKQEQTDGTHLYNDILFPTIKVKGEKVIFVSTPLGKNNILYDMYLKGLNVKFKLYKSILKDIYSDGLVTPEEIEDIKNQIPRLSFEQEFLCKFLDSSLTFFQGFENCFTDFTYDENQPQFIGIDLSATEDGDDTVLTKINQIGQVKPNIIKGNLEQKYNKIAYIINNTKNLKAVYIEQNGVGFAMIESIKKLVKNKSIIINWTTTNSTKLEILGRLAVNIADKSLVFNNEDTELYSQFGGFIYKYTKSGNIQLEASGGCKDDIILATAIALKAKEDKTRLGGYTFSVLK